MLIPPIPGDAAPFLQAALDSGQPIQLTEGVYELSRPIFLPSRTDLRGMGNRTEIVSNYHDALLAIPDAHRNFDPSYGYVTTDGDRWTYRTRGNTGLRFHNGDVDTGCMNASNGGRRWKEVRQLTVDMLVHRHNKGGAMCGLAWWGGPGYSERPNSCPSPWWLLDMQYDPSFPNDVRFEATLSDGTLRYWHFRIGAPGPEIFLRISLHLDAGWIRCYVNRVEQPCVYGSQDFEAGLHFAENPGSPLWVGGADMQAGNSSNYDPGIADCTFRAFRLWSTASPPASYPYHDWAGGTIFYLPFDAANIPRRGNPLVPYSGNLTAWGYLTPQMVGAVSVEDIRVQDLLVRGNHVCTGLHVQSGLDINLERLTFQEMMVGVQIMGGPLNNYPVRIRDLFGEQQRDATLRLQRCNAVVENLTAKYPRRSVLRCDVCGSLRVKHVFNAPTGANTVDDVIRIDKGQLVEIEDVLSNYEDGAVMPNRSYLALIGPPSDYWLDVRVKDYIGGVGIPQKAMYTDALRPDSKIVLRNSLGQPDTVPPEVAALAIQVQQLQAQLQQLQS